MQVWFLVDGIYPELARFVKTMSEPLTDPHKKYAKWQEASRKDVERAFGVLQRKFQFLVRDVEQWYVSDITEAVETCIILHNMMVEERRDRDEEEQHNWYDFNNNDIEHNNNAPIDPAEEFVERQQAETELHTRLQHFFMMVQQLMLLWKVISSNDFYSTFDSM
jgi:hypothetical protein